MTGYTDIARPLRASLLLGLLLAGVFALAACGKQGGGDAAAEGAEGADKATETVPVEVAKAERRAIAASYGGTAALEARADSQVVAKTSGVALQVMVEEGAWIRRAPSCRPRRVPRRCASSRPTTRARSSSPNRS